MRGLIALAAMLLAPLQSALAADADKLPPVVVYAPSPCISCIDWADHLRKNGFEVTMTETLAANMPRLKRWLNVPSGLESVHTAKVAGYFIEGHVPVEDIHRLLAERPDARGLSAPGMPVGSPGMPGPPRPYTVYLIGKDGSSTPFSQHGQ